MNCVQLEPLILAMKRVYGEPKEWNKQVFKKMGKEFVQCLPPEDLMNIAGKKDVFRSMYVKTFTYIASLIENLLEDGGVVT